MITQSGGQLTALLKRQRAHKGKKGVVTSALGFDVGRAHLLQRLCQLIGLQYLCIERANQRVIVLAQRAQMLAMLRCVRAHD